MQSDPHSLVQALEQDALAELVYVAARLPYRGTTVELADVLVNTGAASTAIAVHVGRQLGLTGSEIARARCHTGRPYDLLALILAAPVATLLARDAVAVTIVLLRIARIAASDPVEPEPAGLGAGGEIEPALALRHFRSVFGQRCGSV